MLLKNFPEQSEFDKALCQILQDFLYHNISRILSIPSLASPRLIVILIAVSMSLSSLNINHCYFLAFDKTRTSFSFYDEDAA